MRSSRWLVPALLGLPCALAGQSAPGAWTVTAGVDAVRFGAAARDTVAPAESAVDLRPSGRVGLRMAVQRAVGRWRVEVALGWAGGNVEAGNEAVAIRDRTVDLSRYRVGLGLERALAHPGRTEVTLALRPSLDLWTLDGENRVRAGAECTLALRVPLGGAALEHRIGLGVSGSPLKAEDVDAVFERKRLVALTVGVGWRLPR